LGEAISIEEIQQRRKQSGRRAFIDHHLLSR
jgi:hypothetical protein